MDVPERETTQGYAIADSVATLPQAVRIALVLAMAMLLPVLGPLVMWRTLPQGFADRFALAIAVVQAAALVILFVVGCLVTYVPGFLDIV